MSRSRNHFRINHQLLPMVLARLNIAAASAAIGTDSMVKGNLRDDIEQLVRLAKKQTVAAGKHKLSPSPLMGEGKGEGE